jgi:hypothetical protein
MTNDGQHIHSRTNPKGKHKHAFLLGIALLALTLAMVAYSTSSSSSSISSFLFNVSGYPGMSNSTTLICSGNISCIQDTANKTISLNSNISQTLNFNNFTGSNISNNIYSSTNNFYGITNNTYINNNNGTSTSIITTIKCIGGLICTISLNDSAPLSLTNIYGIDGMKATYSDDGNISLSINATDGLVATYV